MADTQVLVDGKPYVWRYLGRATVRHLVWDVWSPERQGGVRGWRWTNSISVCGVDSDLRAWLGQYTEAQQARVGRLRDCEKCRRQARLEASAA